MARIRPRMSGNIKARLSLSAESFAKHKAALKKLANVTRKEITSAALLAGGIIIRDAANEKAPGPHIVCIVVTGRTLMKSRRFRGLGAGRELKSNMRYAAIGPDADHWYYRFSEFGATKHDISVRDTGYVAFEGIVRAWAKQSGGTRMRPFLRPAVDDFGQEAVNAMANVLKIEIAKAARA